MKQVLVPYESITFQKHKLNRPLILTIHIEKVGQFNLCKVKRQSVPSLSYSPEHTVYLFSERTTGRGQQIKLISTPSLIISGSFPIATLMDNTYVGAIRRSLFSQTVWYKMASSFLKEENDAFSLL